MPISTRSTSAWDRQGLEVRACGAEAGGGGARPDDDRRQAGERGGDGVSEGEGEEVDLGVGPQQAKGEDDQAGQRPRPRTWALSSWR